MSIKKLILVAAISVCSFSIANANVHKKTTQPSKVAAPAVDCEKMSHYASDTFLLIQSRAVRDSILHEPTTPVEVDEKGYSDQEIKMEKVIIQNASERYPIYRDVNKQIEKSHEFANEVLESCNKDFGGDTRKFKW